MQLSEEEKKAVHDFHRSYDSNYRILVELRRMLRYFGCASIVCLIILVIGRKFDLLLLVYISAALSAFHLGGIGAVIWLKSWLTGTR
ncbi:TPA: hypothetical protein MW242_002903 [Acinetobacter baumannii]|nr:hypothetical protein [Acinetobacter baumannii]